MAPQNQILKQCSENGLAEQQVWVAKQSSQQIMSRIIRPIHTFIQQLLSKLKRHKFNGGWNRPQRNSMERRIFYYSLLYIHNNYGSKKNNEKRKYLFYLIRWYHKSYKKPQDKAWPGGAPFLVKCLAGRLLSKPTIEPCIFRSSFYFLAIFL